VLRNFLQANLTENAQATAVPQPVISCIVANLEAEVSRGSLPGHVPDNVSFKSNPDSAQLRGNASP
jgi:hypothetical protein